MGTWQKGTRACYARGGARSACCAPLALCMLQAEEAWKAAWTGMRGAQHSLSRLQHSATSGQFRKT